MTTSDKFGKFLICQKCGYTFNRQDYHRCIVENVKEKELNERLERLERENKRLKERVEELEEKMYRIGELFVKIGQIREHIKSSSSS